MIGLFHRKDTQAFSEAPTPLFLSGSPVSFSGVPFHTYTPIHTYTHLYTRIHTCVYVFTGQTSLEGVYFCHENQKADLFQFRGAYGYSAGAGQGFVEPLCQGCCRFCGAYEDGAEQNGG